MSKIVIQGTDSLPTNLTAATKADLGGEGRPSADFFAGDENRLLLAVLEYWLTQPEHYNPLWLIGETGVGKTLFTGLLTDIFRVEHRDSTVIRLPGSDFARAYHEAIKADATDELRARYVRADLLVIDNLEELAEKIPAQEELCVIVDELLSRGARLIAVSRGGSECPQQLVPRLASRLSHGLMVPISAPDVKTRLEILRTAARQHQVTFDDDALQLLAESLAYAPPVLTHAVAQLAVETENRKQPIPRDLVAEFVASDLAHRRPSLNKITSAVARRFSIKSAELKGPGRRRAVVQARGLAMLLARQLADMSYQKIGEHFGDRDHSTVMHACRQTEALLVADAPTRYAFEELSRKLGR